MKFYWKSAASGNFATAGNWSPSGPPSVFDQAMLTATGAFYTVTATSDQTVLKVNTSADATLDIQGSTFTAEAGTGAGANNGTIDVEHGSTFAVAGTLNNPGTITLFGSGEAAHLQLIGDTTLKGGELHLFGYAQIDGNGTLTNSSNSTIDGAGTIYVPLVNEKNGVIEANGGELDIYSNVTNAGVLDATGGTLFLLSNVITNTFLVSNVITDIGSLKADSGATISLQNTTIHGGTLTGDGLFTVVGTTTFDGSTAPLNNQGDIALVEGEGSIAKLEGTINNTGTIDMGYYPGQGAYPGPYTTTLLIGATGTQKQVTLTGKGTVSMDYGYSDFIEGDADVAGGVPTTLNNLNNTIVGSGRIGDGGLTLKNSGTIAATDDDPLVIDTGARTVTNTGTMAAGSFSTLDIESPLNNAGGKLTTHYSEIDVARGATGGTAVLGIGTIEFGGPTTTAVQFQDNQFTGSSLVLDDSVHFKGVISGFAKANLYDTIDLNDINSATATKVSFSGGVLTVKDGSGHTAQLHFSGAYTINNFHLSDDGHGGTLIKDPPVVEQRAGNAPATIADGTVLEVKVSDSGTVTFAGPTGTLWLDRPSTFTGKVADFGAQESIDLSGTPFGAHTTLGYSENSSDTGGILSVKDGTHIAKLALLGNYMAASFVTASDGYGGTLITEGVQTAQQSLLTHPHA